MKLPTSEQLAARAQVFKALAHPTRLLIVHALAGSECCVGDLTELAEVDMSTVSRHLSLLKETGVVATQKRGPQIFYRLVMPCVTGFFGCVEKAINERATAQLDQALGRKRRQR